MQLRKVHHTCVELTELGFGAAVTGNDDLLPIAQELGKSVVAAGVFNSGLLSHHRPSQGMKYDYQEAPPAPAPSLKPSGTTSGAKG